MFSPKPGQRNLPSSSRRNQLTRKMRGGLGIVPAELQPVAEVVAHVVAAERQHRHRVAAHLAELADRGGRRLRAHRRGEVHAVLQLKAWKTSGMPCSRRPPKMNALIGTPFGSSQSRIDRRALRSGRGEARIGMGGGLAAARASSRWPCQSISAPAALASCPPTTRRRRRSARRW